MPLDHLALIAADSAGLADAARGNLAAPVEHCPGWTVADLVWHITEVQWFWGTIVERRLTSPDGLDEPPRPPDEKLIDRFRDGAERFVEILRVADPATHVWTWAPQQDVAFVTRHQVQETAVHRWDAEHAAARPYAIDRDAALDAIPEALTFSVPTVAAHPDKPGPSLPAPLTLAVTDGPSWTIHPDTPPGTVRFEVDGEPANTRVTGTASGLLLWLYERIDLPVEGDAAVVSAFRALNETD